MFCGYQYSFNEIVYVDERNCFPTITDEEKPPFFISLKELSISLSLGPYATLGLRIILLFFLPHSLI